MTYVDAKCGWANSSAPVSMSKRLGRMVMVGALLVCASPGCGDDTEGDSPEPESTEVDIEGIFSTTTHRINTSGCDEGPAVDQVAFFQIVDNGSTSPRYSFAVCLEGDAETCADTPADGVRFEDPIDGGWQSHENQAMESGGFCRLIRLQMTALEIEGGVRVELRDYLQEVDIDKIECTPDDTEAQAASLPCKELEVLEGTRL